MVMTMIWQYDDHINDDDDDDGGGGGNDDVFDIKDEEYDEDVVAICKGQGLAGIKGIDKRLISLPMPR